MKKQKEITTEEKTENEQTQETEKKQLTPTQIFWIRFGFWLVFALLIPIGIIIWKFNLFQTQTTTSTSITFGGWGIVCCVILFFVIRAICNYVRKGLPYSMGGQILNGIVKIVLPLGLILVVGYILLTTFTDGINNFLFVMLILLTCESIAIPINPFPKYLYEKKKKETQDVLGSALKDAQNEKK